MKLLGWMHRKFRQNGGEPIKDFVIGRPSLDQEQNCYQLPKPTHYARPRRSSSSHSHHKDTFFRNSFAGIDEAGRENDDHDDPTDCAADEVYHGLLAIGTLGSDPVDHHRISVETITEKQQTEDVTADDLKLINDELEKELAKDEDVISSARNSHVSSVKQMEGSGGGDGNVNGGVAVAAVCPLQEYLFGSAVELPETTAAAKKEHRTSLGELFMRSRLAEENGGGGKVQGKSSGSEQQQQQQEKVRDHQVVGVQRMKKMLKRRTTMPIGSASKSSGGGGQSMAAGDSFSAETKLHKILHIFHRKVHPENSAATKKSGKQESYVVKDSIHCDAGGEDGGSKLLPEHDTIIIPQRVIGKDGIRRRGNHFSSSAIALSGSDSNGNREYWIKTDADYLVLEL